MRPTLALPTLLLVVGCGSPSSSEPKTDAALDITVEAAIDVGAELGSDTAVDVTVDADNGADAACDGYAAELCAKNVSCNQLGYRTTFGDDTRCRARVKLGCLAKLAAPSTGATASTMIACAAAMKSGGCEVLAGKIPEACVPTGSLADGEKCFDFAQCKSGLCAVRELCGMCAPATKPGDVCASGKCSPGQVCSGSKCVLFRERGESCGTDAPCLLNSICSFATCVEPPRLGDECTPQFGGLGCEWSMAVTCDSTTRKCVETKIANLGEACTITSVPFVFCNAGTHCDAGRCVVDVADGAACGTTSGNDCSWPAVCVRGKCTVQSPAFCE